MSEKGKQILDTLGKAIPRLTEQEKEKLLSFSEGVAFMADRHTSDQRERERPRG